MRRTDEVASSSRLTKNDDDKWHRSRRTLLSAYKLSVHSQATMIANALRVTMFVFLMAGLANSFMMPSGNHKICKDMRIAPATWLHMTALKPAAMSLMDSGKAFARSGEFLIDLTSQIDLYGGALSQVGALIRNSGDCIAQAAASARFKTGLELVCDELRESATCLTEATSKLKLAVKESAADKNNELAGLVGTSVPFERAGLTSDSKLIFAVRIVSCS